MLFEIEGLIVGQWLPRQRHYDLCIVTGRIPQTHQHARNGRPDPVAPHDHQMLAAFDDEVQAPDKWWHTPSMSTSSDEGPLPAPRILTLTSTFLSSIELSA